MFRELVKKLVKFQVFETFKINIKLVNPGFTAIGYPLKIPLIKR
jgi:hypothetical protein